MIMSDAEHRKAWEQIPWVVAGSADAPDRNFVHAHIAHCAPCRAEFEFQARVHESLAAGEPALHDPGPALQRLWQRIDDEAGAATPPPARRWWNGTRALAAVVAVQAVALAFLAGQVFQSRPDAGYATLSSAGLPSASAVLRVAPSPQMTLGAWQTLLAAEHLRVVEAAADGRHFGLAPADPAHPADAALLARLRAMPELLLVEPLQR